MAGITFIYLVTVKGKLAKIEHAFIVEVHCLFSIFFFFNGQLFDERTAETAVTIIPRGNYRICTRAPFSKMELYTKISFTYGNKTTIRQ